MYIVSWYFVHGVMWFNTQFIEALWDNWQYGSELIFREHSEHTVQVQHKNATNRHAN
jgi:hypothetical protein